MYLQPIGQPIGQPMMQPMAQPVGQPIMSGAFPMNAMYPMMQQPLMYAPPQMMMMAPYPMMVPAQPTTALAAPAAPATALPPYSSGMSPPKNKGNAVLFVGQLNYDATEKQVRELFGFYGHVVNVVMLKDNKRTGERSEIAPTKINKLLVSSSAFVTYATTAEADLAIMSLHDRYCIDNRDKPVQVSYCQKTDIISDFGYRHALQLHTENPANPIPNVMPTPSVGYAVKFA